MSSASPLAPAVSAPAVPPGTTRRSGPGEQHGRRLTAAFEAIGGFPGLVESQRRLLETLDAPTVNRERVVTLLETDLGLGSMVLRAARPATPVSSVVQAVETLGYADLRERVAAARTIDFFGRDASWGQEPAAHRRHVIAVQGAIHRISACVRGVDVELLSTAALLHDVGKLVLRRAHAGYADLGLPEDGTPETRLAAERRAVGVDHALVGGVLVRRWGLDPALGRLVERHHADDDERGIATLRLADLLAHHGHGTMVSPQALTRVARRVGIDTAGLRGLLFDQADAVPRRGRTAVPCPLSVREAQVLRRLAAGRVYKQIAGDLDLSTSTVRTHLHNIYGKLGAVDRAQAVLIAVERGWL